MTIREFLESIVTAIGNIESYVGLIGSSDDSISGRLNKGGHRTVDTLENRDAILPEYREEGMSVYVKETKTVYYLIAGIENSHWSSNQTTSNLEELLKDIDFSTMDDTQVVHDRVNVIVEILQTLASR